jgi:hypothetical protein
VALVIPPRAHICERGERPSAEADDTSGRRPSPLGPFGRHEPEAAQRGDAAPRAKAANASATRRLAARGAAASEIARLPSMPSSRASTKCPPRDPDSTAAREMNVTP